MKRTFLLLFFLIGFLTAFAQEKTISGIVTDDFDGSPLPGATVIVKGTTTGAVTGTDGKYSITVGADAKFLVFSYIGMKTKEVEIAGKSTINVTLKSDSEGLDEVVVTAMGIKKDKKSLGYAVENVKSDELTEGNQVNVVNALQGKVAGVTVTNSGGSPGAPSVIMIRGGSSLSGNNQPLFVVDGIPIDNSAVAQSPDISAGSTPIVANSNRGLDLNSEDIESVSILKGPAAAALYGIKAANGAVIITTKSGKAGKAQISYNGFFSMDNVMGVPEVQTEFGQGTLESSGLINKSTTYSWDTTRIADDVPIYHNLRDFYQQALSYNHNLSYSGGNDKSTVYTSLGRLDQNGVIKGTDYERTSFKIKTNSSLKKNLKIGSSFNYVNSSSDRTRQGSTNKGSFRSILHYPANINMKDYLNEDGSQKIIEGVTGMPMDNPYWSIANNPINNRVDRFIGMTNISYDPFDFLNITYRVGSDMFFEKNRSSYAWESASFPTGYIGEYSVSNRTTTSTFMTSFNKSFQYHSFGLTLGNNIEDYNHRRISWYGEGFIEPDFVGINNVESENRNIGESRSRKRIVSAFGEFKYDWRSLIFITATGRTDWSSTLPKDRNRFFYPSVGMSAVISDIFHEFGLYDLSNLKISYWKLRSTWAQVGKDAPPHVLETPMNSATNSYTIDPEGFFRAVYPTGNPALKPEFTSSFEIGTDLRLFNNRIGIDFSYYNSTSVDQILFIRMPPSAGTFGGYLNSGTINNSGIELLINAQIIKKQDFKWNFDLNFAKAQSYVVALPGEIDRVENSDSWAFNSIGEGAAFLDGSVFGINGSALKRDENGNLLLDEDGMVQEAETFGNIGDRYPHWTMGISNKFQYKNISLNFLFDFSYGNQVLNGTKAALVYYGLDPVTLNRGEEFTFDGLRSTGTTDADGNIIYEPNTVPVVLNQEYYQQIYSQIGENFVEDGSWARLRYVTLTYNLPKKWLGEKIELIQLNATGRNLLLFTNYSGVDPEVNTIGAAVMGTGSIGIDNLGTPSTKGFDFSLRITF